MVGANEVVFSDHAGAFSKLAAGLLSSEIEPRDAHRLTVELVASALGADVTLVYGLSGDERMLAVSAHRGASEALLARIGSLPLESASLAARVARARKAADVDIAAKDVLVDLRVAAELGCGQRALAAPLVSAERLLGVLVCFTPRAESGRDRALPMLSALTGLIAASLSAATQATLEHDRRYRKLFEHALDGIIVTDDEGRLVDVNPRTCELLRASRDELLRRTWLDLKPPELASQVRANWSQFLTTGRCNAEGPFRRADGTTFVGEVTAQAHFLPGRHMGILRDVTARKQSEEALRRSEERLARAQRIAHIGSWEWDIDTNEVAWSDECDRLFGLPPGAGKMTYEQFFSFVHPDDHAEVDEAVRRALGGSLSFSIYHRTLAHDGREQIVHAEGDVIRDEAGHPSRLCATVRDVTEQRRAEMALQKSELLFRQVIETLPVGVWVSDERGQLVLVNPAGRRIWGGARLVGPEQFDEYKAWWVATGEEVKPDEWALSRALRSGEAALNDLVEIEAFDGRHRLVLNSAAPVRDPEGRILGAFVINDDVTEQRRLEAEREQLVDALSTERRWLQTVIDSSPIGIVLCELEKGARFVMNRRAEELLGVTEPIEDVLGLMRQRVHLPDGSKVPHEDLSIERGLRGQMVTGRELLLRVPGKPDVPILTSASPIRGEGGQTLGAVVTYEDITSLKELERLQQEWTSMVAHDLCHPVTTIKTLAGMVTRSSADPTARYRATRIVDSAERLGRMIGDLLDLSRIEARRLSLVRAPTDVSALLAHVIEANEARERVTLVIRGELPVVSIDAQRIEQVVENLLSNAFKYGAPETPIEIVAQARGGEVVVMVRNQGPGITAEDLRALFERFQRGRARGGAIKGLGLGLYIVRGLVEAHGGRVVAESVPGEITTFSFSLPVVMRPEGAEAD
ncbi:PAS domain S-box protein [Polyangium mundeleinium]|uniref:histidine kinase n=1 Tax=Polyangium mundeleinium TaxID=2995306 RepID=A0ABT5ES10_9BACT|nr:PAS domain S-box protein [Polyangium mundeleinium]MDC0744605.1 PAS domain S-box protein [Polyangium mundeleinium]